MKSSRIFGLIAALAIALAACGGSGGEDEAIEALLEEDIPLEVAECIIENVIPEDVPEIAAQTAGGASVALAAYGPCLTDDALVEIFDVDTVDNVRALLATEMANSGSLTTEQAFCLITTVEDQGFDLVDIGGYTTGTPRSEGIVPVLQEAQATCQRE